MKNIIGLWHQIHNLRQPGCKVCPVLLVLWVGLGHVLSGLQSLPLPGLGRNKGPSFPLDVDCSVLRKRGGILVAQFHCRPESNWWLQTCTGWLIICLWLQLQWGSLPAGGGMPSPGSLTFQETGPAPSHPPFSLQQRHRKGWRGQEARLLAFHTEAFVSVSKPQLPRGCKERNLGWW